LVLRDGFLNTADVLEARKDPQKRLKTLQPPSVAFGDAACKQKSLTSPPASLVNVSAGNDFRHGKNLSSFWQRFAAAKPLPNRV
jgi:hypothetical protein